MDNYIFSNEQIDQACQQVEKALISYGVERREALRIKLTFEEVLLEYQEKLGEEASFRVRCNSRFSAIRVEVTVPGESFDPMDKTEEDATVMRELLAGLGLAPSWSYRNGKNNIVLLAKKKPLSGTVKMVGAIGLAIMVGIILNLLPDGIRVGVNDYFLTPVTNAFIGLLSAISGPLVFLSVLGSICSMGNMETLGKIGSKAIKVILLYMTVIGAFMAAFGSLFYHIEKGNGNATSFSQILDLIYDIIPTNLFEPFVTGNALQLIFISVIVGLAMLVLSSKVSGVFSLVEQLSSIVQTMMSGLCSMLPILIFVIFAGMISNGNLAIILRSWKMIVVILLMIAVYYALNLLRISFAKKISPALLFKKAWPTLLMIGVWRAGAAFVIAEENLAPERIDYIYRDCSCKLAITSEVWEEINRLEPLDGYEETDPHDAAYAVYTSGTTGNPKGVLHEYGNLERCEASAKCMGEEIFDEGERFALAAPLNFVASTMVLSYALYRGCCTSHVLSFSTVKNPMALIKYLLLKRITLFFLTPTYARKFEGKTGPFLKKMVVGSEPANRYFLKGVTNYNMYAQSEGGVIAGMFIIDREYDVCPIGKPQFEMKYRVVDDDGNDVPDGETGEFIFESPYVRGYINLPEETAKAFKDGYFYTSDLAQILPDGNIVIRGRKSDMIKINGNRIEPAEIESAIKSILKIDWCAVRGFVGEDQSFICAYYKDDVAFDADSLRAQLQKRLPYYMIPAHFTKIDTIPVKSNGKLDRNALPKPEITDITRTYKEPTNEIEAALCLAMQTVLNMDRIGIDDDFYEMGGDSLASMELLTESGLPGLDVGCIFRGRTAAQIAQLYMEQIQNRDPDGDKEANDWAKLEEHKLTPEQLDMFHYQSYMPNSTMYSLFKLLRFDKDGVDLERMAKCIEMAIKNHPALCTILKYNEAGELVQKYDPNMSVAIRPEAISEDELNILKDTLVAPYKILNAPLFRCRLFETEKAAYLYINVHHMIFDGTSFTIFMTSVINAYLGAPLEPDYYYLVLTRRKQMEFTEFYQESQKYHEDTYGNINWTTYPKLDRKTQENTLDTLSGKEALSPVHISSVEKKFMVSRNEFFIAVALLAIAINTNKNDVHVSWVYNGRDDVASKSSVGLLCRELSAALRLHDKTNLRDIFAEIHNQVRDGIKYSCYPYMANVPQDEDGDIACVIYQKDIREGDDFEEIKMKEVEIAHNNAAAQSVLDIQILDGEDGLKYVFDYAASRYEKETMSEFQNLFKSVVAAIVNANTADYIFAQLKKDVCEKKDLVQKIKAIFAKK